MRRLLVIVMALGAVLLGVPAVAGAQAGPYVALGDSYASGLGTRTYDPASGACRRSPEAYPPLFDTSVVFVACAGADTSDVLVQADSIPETAGLVTLTVGGNDVGFGPVVTTCTVSSDAECIAAVDAAIESARTELPARLDGVLAKIRMRGPSAQVVVLGYPRLFEVTPTCVGRPSLVKRTKLNEGSDVLNAVIQQRVDAAGARFVDVRDAFAGHGICSPIPWINALTLPPEESYHPNDAGHGSGYLPALQAAVPTVSV